MLVDVFVCGVGISMEKSKSKILLRILSRITY